MALLTAPYENIQTIILLRRQIMLNVQKDSYCPMKRDNPLLESLCVSHNVDNLKPVNVAAVKAVSIFDALSELP